MDGRQSKSWSTRRIEYHALDKRQLEATEEQLHAWMQTAIQKNTKSSVCQVMCARPSFVLFSSSPPSPPPFFRFDSFTPLSLLMAWLFGCGPGQTNRELLRSTSANCQVRLVAPGD